MITPFLAAASVLTSRQELGLIYGIAGMAMALVFGCLGMYLVHRRRAMWHETARLALEKGQPIPLPEPDPHDQRSRDKANDFRGGLVLVAAGVGIYLFLQNFIGHNLGYVGAIPGFIGAALLLHGAATALLRKKNGPPKENGASQP